MESFEWHGLCQETAQHSQGKRGCAQEGLPFICSWFIVFLFHNGAPVWVLHFFPGAAHMFKLTTFLKVFLLQLNVIQLQVSIQICDSLICRPCLVLWATSDLPDAVFCSKAFSVYTIVWATVRVLHVCNTCNTEYFCPESWLPDLLPTWEGEGTLETRCFSASPFFPLHQMGLCLLGPHLAFQSPVSFPLYHFLPEAHFSLQLINIPWIIWGGCLSEEYAEMWCRAKPAASHYSQIMPETFCRLGNKARWSGIMCIPRISQTAVFPFKKTQSFQVTAWLSAFVQDRIRSKLALVSWNDCAHVALCSVHKAQGWFLFCPCKLFDYGKIKCYGNCFFTDLICWVYSRLIHKPS